MFGRLFARHFQVLQFKLQATRPTHCACTVGKGIGFQRPMAIAAMPNTLGIVLAGVDQLPRGQGETVVAHQ